MNQTTSLPTFTLDAALELLEYAGKLGQNPGAMPQNTTTTTAISSSRGRELVQKAQQRQRGFMKFFNEPDMVDLRYVLTRIYIRIFLHSVCSDSMSVVTSSNDSQQRRTVDTTGGVCYVGTSRVVVAIRFTVAAVSFAMSVCARSQAANNARAVGKSGTLPRRCRFVR